ncbi:NUDIX hydrolase [Sporosarcina cyprini]|uniref:NUDIX hydrolase n=1 Tax=Sporosarcina cyprini TaxID=2910523 RepID=UPI001EDD5EAE|nr:NUDIX domain-containing protein [Sporosarcina cyprini]MCG3086390.1 NUDIX domain-containing protein [Sporosarcina cyprini]
MEVKRKVLAYITKGTQDDLKLLVFEQKDHPEAGIQVPGGTIEEDELLIDALYREVEEETGIPRDRLELVGKLHKKNHYPKNQEDVVYERNIFHLSYTGNSEDAWENHVYSDGKDNGLTFCCRWVPMSQLPDLAGRQDEALDFMDS